MRFSHVGALLLGVFIGLGGAALVLLTPAFSALPSAITAQIQREEDDRKAPHRAPGELVDEELMRNALPSRANLERAESYTRDLNGDGASEVMVAAPERTEEREREIYIVLLTDLRRDAFTKVGDVRVTAPVTGGFELTDPPRGSWDLNGDGRDELVLSWEEGEDNRAAVVIAADVPGRELSIMRIQDKLGNTGPAYFRTGSSATGMTTSDMSPSESPELIVHARISHGAAESCSTDVYEWNGSLLIPAPHLVKQAQLRDLVPSCD